MYLVSLHGHGTSAWPGSSGAPIECSALTKKPSSPILSSAAWPIRVMVRIETTTYSESVISTPSLGSSAPSGPMQNGTTYMVRPRMQPRYRSVMMPRISAGSIQLLVGTGVDLALGTDEGARFDARHVRRVGQREVGVRLLLVVEPLEGARLDQLLAQPRVLLLGAVGEHHPVRLRQLGDLVRPRRAAPCAWSVRCPDLEWSLRSSKSPA